MNGAERLGVKFAFETDIHTISYVNQANTIFSGISNIN
jgi:hypothetical protein